MVRHKLNAAEKSIYDVAELAVSDARARWGDTGWAMLSTAAQQDAVLSACMRIVMSWPRPDGADAKMLPIFALRILQSDVRLPHVSLTQGQQRVRRGVLGPSE